MKKISVKKMALTRETLGKLTEEQVKRVQGGLADLQEYPTTSDSVNACCC